MKNKNIYKVIACVSIWLSVIIAFFGFAIAKPKAGIIVNETFSIFEFGSDVSSRTWTYQDIENKYIGVSNFGAQYQFQLDYIRNSNNSNFSVYFQIQTIDQSILSNIFYLKTNSPSGIQVKSVRGYFQTINDITYALVNIKEYVDYITDTLGTIYSDSFTFNKTIFATTTISALGLVYSTAGVSIAPCDNIYDLQQNDVAVIYISDVSGFNSSSYQPEITINWGYVDSTDNTIYAVYDPTVNVMKGSDDLEIWLNIPTDASGSVYDSVILNQQSLLNVITDGASTANANIYALYVWLLSDRIQWGLLNFNTAGLPASAQSMNYFTSYTTKYDYINTNTGTMTCRLSISNNFNFITIKNQPVFSVNTINTTLRQGGLLPAWALYNWARGTASGFVSGKQAGAASYQPGNTGYNEIYQAGYNAGLSAQPAAAWYEAAFAAVDSFLNIHIFPNITFGELFGIPFVITVVWFIIRMFRGGGSSG